MDGVGPSRWLPAFWREDVLRTPFFVRTDGRWWSLIVGAGPVFVMLRKGRGGFSHGPFLSWNVVDGQGSR